MSDWIVMKSTWSDPSPGAPAAAPAPARAGLAERASAGAPAPGAEAPAADRADLSPEAAAPRQSIFMPSTPRGGQPDPRPSSPFAWGGNGRSGSVTRSSTFGDGRGSYDTSHSRTTWGPDGQVHQSGSRTTVSRLTSPWGSDTYRIREEWRDGQYRRSGSRTNTSTFSSPWGSETYRSHESW